MMDKTKNGLKGEVLRSCPKDYRRSAELSFNTKKGRIAVTAVGLAAAALCFAVGCIAVPVSELYNVSGIWHLMLRFLVIVVLTCAYLALFELLHSVVLKKILGASTLRVNAACRSFWFTSSDWFSVKAYFTAALLPTAAMFLILLLAGIILPSSLFWIVYIIQIINLAIPAPYYCLACGLLKKKPKAALIRDEKDAIGIWTA